MRTSMIALACVLAACSKTESPAVGTWTVDVAASADKRIEDSKGTVTIEGPADEQKMFMDMMKEQLAQQLREAFSSATLVIRGDGHYALTYRAEGEAIDEAGTWTGRPNDKTITLACATVNGTHDRCPRDKVMQLEAAKKATFEDPSLVLAGKLTPFGSALVVARN
jgi:hypothetical protein